MIYMFLAEGFEEVEALAPLDLLRRAGLSVTTVGVGGKTVTGAHGISVLADISDKDYSDDTPEMIFLPGGMLGTLNLAASEVVQSAIQTAVKTNAYLAAICAAPSILGDLGLLHGKEAICYPGFEERLIGAKISKQRVVRDGKILTAAGMGVAVEFGLAIIEELLGKQKAEELRRAVLAD
ncbi:MAG: DJ-1/PfpI family protein [Clostridia bacterium]|nr:DJ-1/PfpI family protein [Clostridia bacterium]